MTEQKSQPNQYVQSLKEAHKEVMELVSEAMQLGNYKRAEQILRDGFYAIAIDDYQRSIHIYRGIKKWAKENQCEELIKKNLSGLLKLIEGKQKELCNFDQVISPIISEIRRLEGEKK